MTKSGKSNPRPIGHVSQTLPLPISEANANTTHTLNPISLIKKKIKPGENLATIFNQLGINANDLYSVLQCGLQAKLLQRLYPNHQLTLMVDAEHHLKGLSYDIDDLNSLIIHEEENQYSAQTEQKILETRQNFAHAQIHDSLFVAGQKAGLDDDVIMQLASIFAWDIDFALDIRPGDSFSVLHEERYIDGEKVSNGPILVAEFNHQGKTISAIRYQDPSGHTDYYTPKGVSLRKAFIRSPVKFTRISSRFSLGRKHPILHHIRAHKGVDYAAPRGTPVKAAGDGKIIFAGVKGGYGNAVILKHGMRYSTLYGHLSRFKRGLRSGQQVKQGQVIGYVGSTGLATGPHLHFEFRVGKQHRNPLTVPLPKAKPIVKKYLNDFKLNTRQLLAKIAKQQQIYLTLNDNKTDIL